MTQSHAQQPAYDADLFEKSFLDLIAQISGTFQVALPTAKISGLLDQILPAKNKAESATMLCVISAHTDEGAGVLAADLAWLAAERDQRRVLLIDAGMSCGKSDMPTFQIPTTITAFLNTPQKPGRPIARLEKTNFHVAVLGDHNHSNIPENTAAFTQFIANCQSYFNVIIIHVNNALASPHTLRLARLCDGILISVRAEKSRMPVLSHLKLVLERTKTPIIGAVLYARRRYIPGFLYRFIFRG